MSNYEKKQIGMAFWGILIGGLIQVVLWSLAVRFLPSGWWIVAINILGFLLTMVFIGLGSWQTLKIVLPSGVALLIGAGIWLLMAIVIRTVILGLLGG